MDEPQPAPNPQPAHMPTEDGQWHRLHATSLFFGIGSLARRLLLPGVILLAAVFLRGGDDGEGRAWELWFMVLFVPAVLFQLLQYFTLRYRFSADELQIRRGLIFRSERHIPFRRLQNIDLVQGPLHRLLSVARVKLDTAGGAEAEAELSVLSLEAVEVMRARVFADRAAGVPPSADIARDDGEDADDALDGVGAARASGHIVLRLPIVELIKVGIISWRGLVLVGLLIGLIFEMDLFEDVVKDRIEDWFEAGFGNGINWWFVAALAGVPIVLMLLSVAWSIIRFYDFTLERCGDDLRVRCGLLTKISATVPRKRIQLVSVRETLLHRAFRSVSVRIETAGGKKGDSDNDTISEKWIVPIVRKRDVGSILEELSPGLSVDDESVPWQGLAPKAMSRMLAKANLLAIVLGLAGLFFWQPWGALAILPLSAWFSFLAVLEARYMAFALTDLGVAFRSGVWTRKISAARYEKLQVVSLGTTPFDRRHAHASIHADTAGAGPAAHRISVPYVNDEVARETVEALYGRIGRSTFKWA